MRTLCGGRAFSAFPNLPFTALRVTIARPRAEMSANSEGEVEASKKAALEIPGVGGDKSMARNNN